MVDGTANPPAPTRNSGESPAWSYVLLGMLALFIIAGMVINHSVKGNGANSGLFTQWKILLGVIATLGIFSILYRENPVFRFLEHIFIGLATGYGVVITWTQIIWPRWVVPMMPSSLLQVPQTGPEPIIQGQWWLFFALPIGLLFYTVYFPRLSWMNRLLIGVMMGYFAGYQMAGFIGILAPQITTSFKPPVTLYRPEGMPIGPNNFEFLGIYWHPFSLIFIAVLLCVLAYFYFSVEHRQRWIRQPAVAGRYMLMITLGAIFGTTVMGRFSLVIVRLEYLLNAFRDWFVMIFK